MGLALPLWFDGGDAGRPAATLVQLVTPRFHRLEEVAACIPLCDGVLAVVDCAEGLTAGFRSSWRACVGAARLRPVLLLNKLDKLLALEPDDERCFQVRTQTHHHYTMS